MFCAACGNRLPADAAFCNQCGSKVPVIRGVPPGQVPQGKITVKFDDRGAVDRTVLRPQPPSSSLPPMTLAQSTGPIASSSQPLALPPVPYAPSTSASGAWPQYQQTSEPLRALQPMQQVQRVPQPLVSSQLLPPTVAPVLPPPSGLQRFLLRVFQPALAGNPILGVTLGGLLAAIGGALVAALLLNIAHAMMPAGSQEGMTGELRADILLGLVWLHTSFRESLQLLLIMLGVGTHVVSGSGSSISSSNYFAPLHGLLLFPALFLVLGGYVAASTDFSNQVQTSLLRGAAVAIPYTILLFVMASQVNGVIPDANGGVSQNPSLLNMDLLTLLIFGLLWGALFGVVGASLKVARGYWRRMIYYFFYTNRHPQLVGMIAGGLAATGLGIALSLLAVYCFVAYTSYSHPFLANLLCMNTDWQALTLWGIVNGPLHAVNLFAFSFGAPVTLVNQGAGGGSCFYTYSPHTTLGLLNGNLHLQSWFYALLLIPAISLFLGGRVSAAAARVQGTGPGAVQGILIAASFTVLMIVLTLISTISYTYASTGTSSGPSFLQSAGVGTFDLLLWALLSSAVLGALGGMYQTSTVKKSVSHVLASCAYPLVVLCNPLFYVLDRLRGQMHTTERSSARGLFYSAFLCALLLAVGSAIVGNLLINMNQSLTYTDNLRILNISSVLLIVIPGLLLLCAVASALAANPFAQSQQARRTPVSAPMPRFYEGV